MLIILFSALFSSEQNGWRVTPEIYTTPIPSQIAVSESGQTYLLDRRESRILRYDANGDPLPPLGREGQGPGEFQRPFTLSIHQGKIYIFQLRAVSIFSLEGTFIEKRAVPGRSLPRKVVGGWIAIEFAGGVASENRLLFYDDAFEEQKTILEWERSRPVLSPNLPLKINPARDAEIDAISEDGTVYFFRKPGEAQFRIIDGSNGDIKETVSVPFPTVPFDEDWGRREFEKSKARFSRRGSGMKIIADFPESFPTITTMSWHPEGCVQVTQSVAGQDPYEHDRVRFYDVSGVPVTPKFPKYSDYIVAIRDEMAYLAGYDAEGEQMLLVCHPLSSLVPVLEELVRLAKPEKQ